MKNLTSLVVKIQIKSFIETNTYFINDFHTTMVISVSGENVDNLLKRVGYEAKHHDVIVKKNSDFYFHIYIE